MSDIEAIKKKKLAEMMQQQQSSQATEQQAQQQLAQLETMVKQKFSKEALQRYGNIKAAAPEKAQQILMLVAGAMQQGNIQTIDDQTFKALLEKLTPKKRDIKIRRV